MIVPLEEWTDVGTHQFANINSFNYDISHAVDFTAEGFMNTAQH